ncbi:substrate-binding domain-containing protein [Desulfurispora thermophila]|uniref:substrate-binding domain-containing protein n=1 Tax=Desulfurispora thermophila TaxID=265470 RepID=UPI00036A4D2C
MKKQAFRKWVLWLAAVMLVLAVAGCGARQSGSGPAPEQNAGSDQSQVKDVILATTTSTQDSGLLDVLVPDFEKKTGYRVKTIAVGTGQALKMGEKGEADVLLTHAPKSEKPLVDSGVVVNYRLVMHNDFVLAGPAADPAGIKQAANTADAFKRIAQKGAIFVSRGDDSGTHKKELSLWEAAGIKPQGQKWYQETGSGMGQTLNVASEKQGYVLTDRATFLAQRQNLKLEILYQGDKGLLNIYHVMQVNPEKFSKVNAAGAKAFVDYLVSPETQKIIAEFGRDKYGEPLFFADAGKEDK